MHANWMINAASLLRDPIMMNWAILYYAKFDNGEQKEWMTQNWFTVPTLKYWIKRDDEIVLVNLFRHLPRQHFTGLASLIAERWSLWPVAAACVAARVLANVAEESAARVFTKYVAEAKNASFEHPRILSAIYENLFQLTPGHAKPILEILLPWMVITRNRNPEVLAGGLSAAIHCWPEVAPGVIDCMLMQAEPYEPITAFVDTLLGSRDYINQTIPGRAAGFSYVAASRFYEAGAPLQELDAALAGDNPLRRVMELWLPYRERSTLGKRVWESIVACNAYQKNNYTDQLTVMAVAMLSKQIESSDIDIAQLNTSELLSLAAEDVNFNLRFDQVLACLRQHPKADVIAQIQCRITPNNSPDEANNMFVGKQAHKLIRLAGALGWVEFIDGLIACLENREGEGENSTWGAAELALQRIGKPAGDALIQGWDKLESVQKWSAAAIIAINAIIAGGAPVGGDGIADFVLARFTELSAIDEDIWADLVTISADPALAERLSRELRRNQEYLDLTYYRLSCILDIAGKEVNALRKRVRARHAALLGRIKNAELEPNHIDIACLPLALTCPECGDTNIYQVKGVLIGKPVDQEPMLLADEFPCASCAACADFALGNSARRTVLERIALAKRQPSIERAKNDKIMAFFRYMELRGEDGSDFAPFPATHFALLKKLESNPRDASAMRHLGNLAREAQRPKKALAWFRQAYEIDHDSLLNSAALAVHLESLGEKAEAFEILADSVADRENWKVGALKETRAVGGVVSQFNQLRLELGRHDVPVLPLSAVNQTAKPGRNDACTCGSGKKYKKCCGG